jgi:glutamate/tyrosine decarboxylase-like PLP-dependent enzyme
MNMNDSRMAADALWLETAKRAIAYRATLAARRVSPEPQALGKLVRHLGGALPEEPTDPQRVLAELDRYGSPATMASAGGRFFGFVIGGSLPEAVAAGWLATAWDQNTGLMAAAPATTLLEQIALDWILEILDLPRESGGAFVTGCQMANFTALAAARHAILARLGWDVESRGLFGAPEIPIVVGADAHSTILKALAMLGLGRDRVLRVPIDAEGRMRSDALPDVNGPVIVCMQHGNVNSGAFDPTEPIVDWARRRQGWVHVDGAFGLWARASAGRAHLGRGAEQADSWATDAHKWLNVPYDCGIALVRDAGALRGAMGTGAAYLQESGVREPMHYSPELSRRARGVEVWAALRSLGRKGVSDLVERCCGHAGRFAEALQAAGYEVLNDVQLNQVLVSFGDDDATRGVIARIQAEGTCWCSGTEWRGRAAMRISVSSWATTTQDVETSIAAIRRAAAAQRHEVRHAPHKEKPPDGNVGGFAFESRRRPRLSSRSAARYRTVAPGRDAPNSGPR